MTTLTEDIIAIALLDEYSINFIEEIVNDRRIIYLMDCMKKEQAITYWHSLRVFVRLFLVEVNYSSDKEVFINMCRAALLHDVGKMKVPLNVLCKEDALTESEWSLIKRHPIESYNTLKKYGFSNDICIGVLQHHEKTDQTGYPSGIDWMLVSRYSKTIALYDVFDALVSDRPYKKPFSTDVATNIIVTSNNIDKEVLNRFIEVRGYDFKIKQAGN